MRGSKRLVALGFVAGFLMVTLTGCDPKGTSCNHPGDVKATGGHVYHCMYSPYGSSWQ